LIGFAMAARVLYWRLFVMEQFNELATVSAIFFVLAGIQMICTSIMCEYISRIYNEVQRRPYFIVEEVIE
ncbi:MAG: glycosyltransferase, partial [Candidatus Hydrogenedentes bacterium]|nr:glycosyltransferase [Candidatus Hydrogenedentota bacterium]